jgi:peptidoglycan hydrolase-like protein with peptidoglycan-binding domain
MPIKLAGFSQARQRIQEIQSALQQLNGTITEIQFDRNDPASVQRAIRQMEEAVDRKIAPYRDNSTVNNLRHELRKTFVPGFWPPC